MTLSTDCSSLRSIISGLTLASSILLSSSVFAEEGESDGNRYYLERYYQGDISSAQAFMEAVVKKGKWTDRSDKLIILDVRDATEYKRGHPEGAYHFPYPRIYRECVNNTRPEDGGGCNEGTVESIGQDPEDLFLMVEEKFPGKSQRFATLCRTGFRSVLVANILSKPEVYMCELKYEDAALTQCQNEYADRGYTRVSNIWQGFVGQPMAGIISQGGKRYVVGNDQELTPLDLPDGSEAKGFVAFDLDLDNDGGITAADKDGWRYHQGLPYDIRLLPKLKNEAVDDDGYYDMP
jgi:rhodanese-related sulfurtransferase